MVSQEVPQRATQACWRKPLEEVGWLPPTWIQSLIPPMECTLPHPHPQREGAARETSWAGPLGHQRGLPCLLASQEGASCFAFLSEGVLASAGPNSVPLSGQQPNATGTSCFLPPRSVMVASD